MAEDTVARHTRTQTDVHVFAAQVTPWERNGTIALSIPTPRCEGDKTKLVAYLEHDDLRRLRDDISALLARLEGCPTGGTTPDECAMMRERATAGLAIPGMEPCPIHDEAQGLTHMGDPISREDADRISKDGP